MNTRHSPPRAGLLTKRALVIVSHAVERAALAGLRGEPSVVIAMFQRLPYFEREREVYARIAELATTTVVGLVDGDRSDLPHGVVPVVLREDEALAREWSVVVLTPAFGATVVAQDLEDVGDAGGSIEASRLFHGRWGFRRDEAYAEVVRLRDTLGDRLAPSTRAAVDEVLRRVTGPAAIQTELRAEAALRHVTGRLDRQRGDLLRLREQVDDERGHLRDPLTGLHTPEAMDSWLGTSAPGTLPLGLVFARIEELADLEEQHGSRVCVHTEINIADLLREDLRPVDRAVRLSKTEFLLVRPALSDAELSEAGRRLARRLAVLHDSYPFVEVTPAVSTTLTRSRPLPVRALGTQLADPWTTCTGTLRAAPAEDRPVDEHLVDHREVDGAPDDDPCPTDHHGIDQLIGCSTREWETAITEVLPVASGRRFHHVPVGLLR
ncbi:DICT sensory domain-containing protein [Umezawaea beigongshangensis]|uniref:DICT sensory domain-containing protein n=1 Tax=Umezawaea beigongshangensis TaxID=2780383 RepID=UPI0018F19172|nr:DICT sensory domain-containing protein [Umezawaea beigongshangensis]